MLNFTINPDLWNTMDGTLWVKSVSLHDYFIVPKTYNEHMHNRVFTGLRKDPASPSFTYYEVGSNVPFPEAVYGAAIITAAWRVHVVVPDEAPAAVAAAVVEPEPAPLTVKAGDIPVGGRFRLVGGNMTLLRKPTVPGTPPAYIRGEARRQNGSIVSFITVTAKEADVIRID